MAWLADTLDPINPPKGVLILGGCSVAPATVMIVNIWSVSGSLLWAGRARPVGSGKICVGNYNYNKQFGPTVQARYTLAQLTECWHTRTTGRSVTVGVRVAKTWNGTRTI
jgi:hypothetical protein